MNTSELLAFPGLSDLQNWARAVLSVPGLGVVLLILLVYFGLKATYALVETVEELVVEP